MNRSELLKAIAQPTNQQILNHLAIEPSYPRRIGALLSLAETEVARRLRRLERLGFVTSGWQFVGKNVKMYSLAVRDVRVSIRPEGVQVSMQADGEKPKPMMLLDAFEMDLPFDDGFFGREAELEILGGSASVVVVEGMPGIGKTSLLARFAAKQPRGTVFWHSFRGVESLPWLAHRVALFLARHDEPELLAAVNGAMDLPDLRELLIRAVDVAGLSFIFDDAHRIKDPLLGDLLQDAAERMRSAKLLIGSRQRPVHGISGDSFRILHLGGLDDQAIEDVFNHKGVDFDPELLPRIDEEVGGHPLALNLFLETVLSLAVAPEVLLDRIPEKDLAEWLLAEVHSSLSDDESRVLALASLFRSEFTEKDLSAISTRSIQGPLIKIRKRLLVQVREHGFILHEVIRNFFYGMLSDKQKMHEKVARYYLGRGTVEGRFEAMHHLLAAGRRDRVLALLEENLDLREFDLIDSAYHSLYMEVLEMFTEVEVDDNRRWALILDEKGDLRFHRGEYEAALEFYDASVGIFEVKVDRPRLADLAWKRGMALSRLGRKAEALRVTEKALTATKIPPRERRRLQELRRSLNKESTKSTTPRAAAASPKKKRRSAA